VPFSTYDANALRVVTPALFEALTTINRSAPRALSDAQKAYFRNRIIRNVTDAYDSGEHDPEALKRAALRGLFVSRLER
jgi:hypothetical protein